MLEYLDLHKRKTVAYLRDYLARRTAMLETAGSWGPDVIERLLDYSSAGKMIRGALVYLGYALAGGRESDRVAPVAAAMELTQSFLLIHDDIMDQDQQRRGKPSVHKQYTDLAWKRGYRGNTARYGEAMGICAGDIAFFLACDLLVESAVEPPVYRELMKRFGHEVALVGVAQMHDVTNGVRLDEVAEDEIMQLYRYKTGRYTFSLPLMLGAIAADEQPDRLDALGRLGEEIGIIFQIKDDEIGIFSSDLQIGKPVGSDISEDKKTVLRSRLFAAAPAAERETLDRLFGAQTVSGHDVDYIRALVDSLGVRAQLQSELEARAAVAYGLIDELFPAAGPGVDVLQQLVDYNLNRDR